MTRRRLWAGPAVACVLLLVASACRQEPAPEGTPSPEETGIQSVADLGEGDVVGVQSGTTGEIWAKENLEPKGVELRAFPEGPDAYAALEACQVDGAVNDEVTAVFEAEERPDLEVVEAMETDEVYGIAVNPENQALLDAVNVALRDIVEDGTYEEFFAKYPLLVEQLERASIVEDFTSTATADEPPEFTTLAEGTLKVGSDIPYLPFEFREEGKLVGFEIDLINEIASRLGLETEIVDTGFDTIFTQLAAGRFDVVIAASTITPDREKEVNFSDGYFKAQQSLTVNPTC